MSCSASRTRATPHARRRGVGAQRVVPDTPTRARAFGRPHAKSGGRLLRLAPSGRGRGVPEVPGHFFERHAVVASSAKP